MTKTEVIALIKNEIASHGWTHKEAAEEWHISAAYLSDILKGNRDPGTKVLDEFGLYKSVSYEPKDTSGVGIANETDFRAVSPRQTSGQKFMVAE